MKICILGSGNVAKQFYSYLKNSKKYSIFIVSNVKPDWKLNCNFSKRDIRKLNKLNCDVIVNCLPSKFNKLVLQLAINSNSNYLDFSTFSSNNPEHFKFRKKFKNKKLKGIANVGLAPGISNLLIANLVDSGERNIEMYFYEQGNSSKLSWNYSDFLYTMSDKPMWVKNSKITKVQPYSKKKKFKGVNYYAFYADEILSLNKNLKIKSLEIRSGGSDIEYARKLFLKIKKGQKADESKLSFGEFKGGKFSIFTKGKNNSNKIEFNIKSGNYISKLTAYSGFVFLQYLEKTDGLIFPEEFNSKVRNQILRKIAKKFKAKLKI